MVAELRALPDAALAVALLAGPRQYTLATIHVAQQQCSPPTQPPPPPAQPPACPPRELTPRHCDSTAQAVDGRYASVYKMAHCQLQPTSPPELLSEFPPQKAHVCPGEGSFVVGGGGSGESFSPRRAHGSFRGAMCWPDRGAVFSPRPSRQAGAFARSLRRYPPPAGHTLLCYSHYHTAGRWCQRGHLAASPARLGLPVRAGAAPCPPDHHKGHKTQVYNLSPASDCPFRGEEGDCVPYPLTPDAGHTGDNTLQHLANHTAYYPSHYVNMETQVEVLMMSREVATTPLDKRSKRNVAVPLSPCTSHSHSLQQVRQSPLLKTTTSCKCIQACPSQLLALKVKRSSETSSSVNISSRENIRNAVPVRKSKSQELNIKNGDENPVVLSKKEGVSKKKEEISVLLSDLLNINQNEAIYFVNNVVYNLKHIFNTRTPQSLEVTRPQTVVIQRNSLENVNMQAGNESTEFSTERFADQDNMVNNLEGYSKQLSDAIKDWMQNIHELSEIDNSSKETIADDLAGDIVDRQKYHELNPDSKGSEDDELEYMKYQIYKRVNKLLGENTLNAIGHASTLMSRLENIAVPTFAHSVKNKNELPTCPDGCEPIIQSNCNSENRKMSYTSQSPCQTCNSSKLERAEPNKSIMMPGKTFMELNRRTHNNQSACDICVESIKLAKCEFQNNDTVSEDVIKRGQQFESSPMQSVVASETEISHVPIARPRTTSSIEPAQATCSTNRRYSEPCNIHPPETLSKTTCKICASSSIASPNVACNASSNEVDALQLMAAHSIRQLNEGYEVFLNNWIQQIPIVTSKPEEDDLVDIMRHGIHNGVWKAITKLRMNPATFTNEFYYQDLLDDEIEDLLNLLPQSTELLNKKQFLKSQLLERTTALHMQTLSVVTGSFKQHLVDNVTQNLPRKTIDHAGENTTKVIEEIHKLNIVEDFIMYTTYKERNKLKANIYRNKLMKHVQKMFDDVKQNHGKELVNIDEATYKDAILEALHKVPLPSDDTIREEAEEIIIGTEIDHWFEDLPLYPNDNYIELLCRKRHRDILSKKLHDLDKQFGIANCEDKVRQEIRKLMQRLPLRAGEEPNVDFMVEELVNRLRNRPKDIVISSDVRRQSHLPEANDYDDFSRNMQLCSSVCHDPGAKKRRIDENSYTVVGGQQAGLSYAHNGHFVQSPQPTQNNQPISRESQQECLSFENTNAASMLANRDPRSSVPREYQIPSDKQPGTQHANINQSCCRRGASIQTGPSVKIMEKPVANGPSFSPCGEDCMPPRGSLRRDSLKDGTSVGPQTHVTHRKPAACKCTGTQAPDLQVPADYLEHSTKACGSCSIQIQTNEESEDPSRFCGVSRRSMCDFSGPIGYSTPLQRATGYQQQCRVANRPREGRPIRDVPRRKLDLVDSDDSGSEVQCRCMEHVSRSRRKRTPMTCDHRGYNFSNTCDDFVRDLPHCFAMRYPYSHYF